LIDYNFIVGEITENTKNREEILKRFEKGEIKIILAIKILDQGINIPKLNSCILAANTGNVTQFIQRRGRLLRIDPDNPDKIAKIYDLFIPKYKTINDLAINKYSEEIIISEVFRLKVFLEDCINKEYVKNILKKSFGLEKLDDFDNMLKIYQEDNEVGEPFD